jgi:hypothetical protein
VQVVASNKRRRLASTDNGLFSAICRANSDPAFHPQTGSTIVVVNHRIGILHSVERGGCHGPLSIKSSVVVIGGLASQSRGHQRFFRGRLVKHGSIPPRTLTLQRCWSTVTCRASYQRPAPIGGRDLRRHRSRHPGPWLDKLLRLTAIWSMWTPSRPRRAHIAEPSGKSAPCDDASSQGRKFFAGTPKF